MCAETGEKSVESEAGMTWVSIVLPSFIPELSSTLFFQMPVANSLQDRKVLGLI
jgi:hypothetical protein